MQELEAALAEEGTGYRKRRVLLFWEKICHKGRDEIQERIWKQIWEKNPGRGRKQKAPSAGNENQSSSGFLNGTDLFGNKKAEGDPEPAEQEFPLNPENAVNPEGENPENGMEFTYAKENSGSGFPANNLEADGRGAHEDAQMKFAIHRSEPEQSGEPDLNTSASSETG